MRIAVVIVLTLPVGLACEDGETALEATPACGNGVLEPLEACDGDQLNGYDCAHFGYSGGRLRCTETCAGYYVDACAGVPAWAPPADPCAACGPGQVCRASRCEATCPQPALGADGPLRYDLRRRRVRVSVDPMDRLPPPVPRPPDLVAWSPETGATIRAPLAATGEVELLVPPGRARLFVVPPDASVSVWAGPWLPETGDVALSLAPTWRQVQITVAERLSPEISLRPLDEAGAWPREVREASDLRAPLGSGSGAARLWVLPGRYAVTYAGAPAVGFGRGGVPPIAPDLDVPAGDGRAAVLLDADVRRFELQVNLPSAVFGGEPLELRRIWLDDPAAEIPLLVDARGVATMRLPAGDYAFRFRGLQSPTIPIGEVEAFAWAPPLVALEVDARDAGADRLRLEQVQGPWREEWRARRGGFGGYAPRGRVRAAVERTFAGERAWESLGTWDLERAPGETGGPPLRLARATWARLTVDLRVGTAPVTEAGAQVQLRPRDRPELLAAVARVAPGAPLALRAPVGRYRVVLVGDGRGAVPAGSYVLDPDFALERDTARLFDARVVPVRLRSGLPGSDDPAGAPRWFVAPYPGLGSGGAPRPALEGLRTVPERRQGALFDAFPGRYRALVLAPGTAPRAQLLDADLVFEADAPVGAALGRDAREVEIEVQGEADVVVLTGATWTARLPLGGGVGRAVVPAYDYGVAVEAQDIGPRAWPVRSACP